MQAFTVTSLHETVYLASGGRHLMSWFARISWIPPPTLRFRRFEHHAYSFHLWSCVCILHLWIRFEYDPKIVTNSS